MTKNNTFFILSRKVISLSRASKSGPLCLKMLRCESLPTHSSNDSLDDKWDSFQMTRRDFFPRSHANLFILPKRLFLVKYFTKFIFYSRFSQGFTDRRSAQRGPSFSKFCWSWFGPRFSFVINHFPIFSNVSGSRFWRWSVRLWSVVPWI